MVHCVCLCSRDIPFINYFLSSFVIVINYFLLKQNKEDPMGRGGVPFAGGSGNHILQLFSLGEIHYALLVWLRKGENGEIIPLLIRYSERFMGWYFNLDFMLPCWYWPKISPSLVSCGLRLSGKDYFPNPHFPYSCPNPAYLKWRNIFSKVFSSSLRHAYPHELIELQYRLLRSN